MPRIIFEKTGNAVWMSHLDLMRLFQRAFKRAGLPLKHTQGFSPKPSVSIALPLSVGVHSICELLDFELDTTELLTSQQIVVRLNRALVDGVHVLECYDEAGKLRDLTYLRCKLTLKYDLGCDGAAVAIKQMLAGESVVVPKKTKNGIQDQNIIPMIRSFSVLKTDENTICLHARICCQNPSLNPNQMAVAISHYLPELKPDFVSCKRIELYDHNNEIFR